MTKHIKGLLSLLFKNKLKSKAKSKSKVRTPVDIVKLINDHLVILHNHTLDHALPEKIEELGRLIAELKCILYGTSESEPNPEACAQVTHEFFQENTLRLLIICLPELDLEARKDATQVVANLQRQQVHSRLIACDYLEANTDLLDILVSGYEIHRLALHYGNMLRECIRHQSIAKYVLESHTRRFFDYIQLPDFDVSSDAAATFKELFTRHKSTVAEFLATNYDWVNHLLQRVQHKIARISGLHHKASSHQGIAPGTVLFAANRNKPRDIVAILVANRSKLLRFFGNFKIDKENEQFEADKAQVIKEIAELEPGQIRSFA
ncbi:hypothetical protein KSS87_000045 [Heliosperma pusillum]|nr:hypothetical protein KSS87_000045 [Heliosperma pusillum]